jgi:hypothetical protein
MTSSIAHGALALCKHSASSSSSGRVMSLSAQWAKCQPDGLNFGEIVRTRQKFTRPNRLLTFCEFDRMLKCEVERRSYLNEEFTRQKKPLGPIMFDSNFSHTPPISDPLVAPSGFSRFVRLLQSPPPFPRFPRPAHWTLDIGRRLLLRHSVPGHREFPIQHSIVVLPMRWTWVAVGRRALPIDTMSCWSAAPYGAVRTSSNAGKDPSTAVVRGDASRPLCCARQSIYGDSALGNWRSHVR